MKFHKIVIALMCAGVLSIGLVGCGGSGGPAASSEDFSGNFVGTWDLVSIDATENASSPEDIAMMKELGLTCTLTLTEDGSATLDLFGEATQGTWTATSAEAATVEIEGQSVNMTVSGGQLVFDQGGDTKLNFEKGSATTSANAPAAAESSAASDASAESDGSADAAEETADAAADAAAADDAAPAEETTEETPAEDGANSEAA